MNAEFEEKTYEQHLTSELVCGRRNFFPAGQVLENLVGFDMAIHTSNREFWNLFPYMYPWWRRLLYLHPRGVYLKREWWLELEHTIEYFPKFKFNCFIQAKRPARMVRSDAEEYSFWDTPYFRYDTFFSQQRALETLADNTSGKAIVTYACPAFHTYSELWDAIRVGQLVKQSNFCAVNSLKGHSRYSYVSAGNKGIAHSEPTPIESLDFEIVLDKLAGLEPAQSNLSFLIETSEAINSAAENSGALYKTYQAVLEALVKNAEGKLGYSLSRIYAFEFICNVQVLIGHEGFSNHPE